MKRSEKGVVHILPLLLVALLVSAVVIAPKIDSNISQSRVLSEDDSNDNSGSGSQERSEENKSEDVEDVKTPEPAEIKDENETETEIESENKMGESVVNIQRTETEVRYRNGTIVKTKIEDDGEERVDIVEGGRHLRFRTRDGVTTLTYETEEGEELESSEMSENDEVEAGSESARLRIRTREGKVLLSQRNVSGVTDFPVLVDQETGVLTITTPSGQKTVTILPQQAVDNMLAANIIDRILSSVTIDPTNTASSGATPSVSEEFKEVEIEEENGELVYVVNGLSEQKLLGFINVVVPKTVVASASTGEVVTIKQSLFERILDSLSF